MKILILGKNKDKKELVDLLVSLKYGIYDVSTLPKKFKFSDIDEDYQSWGTDDYIKALGTANVQDIHRMHKEVIEYCVSCLLLLPASDSDMFLAGILKGKGKKVIAYNKDPLVLDVNHLFLTKILYSTEQVERYFKQKKEASLLSLSPNTAKKSRSRKKEKQTGIAEHNAKQFLATQKLAVREGKKDFKFDGTKFDTKYSKHIVRYLTNKGWV